MRLAAALAGLSLATDVGNGFPLEKSLRDAIVASRLGEELGLPRAVRSDAFYTALLLSIGCTANSHENAALLGGDDIAFEHLWHQLDPGHTGEFLRDVVTRMGAWAPPAVRARTVVRFLRVASSAGPAAGRSACEVSESLARRIGLSEGVVSALGDAYERFDGRGIPKGTAGGALQLPARVAHVAGMVELAHRSGGVAAARAIAMRRRGGHLDPELVDAFLPAADDVLAGLDEVDALEAALAAEPPPHARLAAGSVEPVARALADFADLKCPWTLGHSPAVADLAARAAPSGGHEPLRLAALVHDVGRVSVPNGIWDKPGPLGAGERDRMRLHAYYTERILSRTPAYAHVSALAAAHHERLDGSGYHRGLPGAALDPPARVLAAADAYAAMTADRPHRRALEPERAAREARAEAAAGRLCRDAVEAVLAAAGHRARRPERPAGLSDREVEVLRLLARGLTNKGIAAELVVSPRTVQHHVAHIYEKIDRRTRAGAALFAVEHDLIRR
jgi:HD-GYP domain-containing protein (c-di-GMP phosphodiesterase class II)